MTQRLKDNNITLDENEDNFHEDMYFHLYPDVVTEFDCSQGWVHYTEHGIQEKRIFPPKSLIHKFDKIRYCNVYPDVLTNYTLDTAWLHFINDGLNENRYLYIIGDTHSLMSSKIKYIEANESQIHFDTEKEEKITILIRTCYRPLLFKRCIESILQQRYTNVHIIICYDTLRAIDYLSPYINKVKNCKSFYCSVTSTKKYKFNLYCNLLLKKVKTGYCIYLDDDNEFTHANCLNIINHYLQHNKICVWNYLRADKVIYPCCMNNITIGEIDSSSFCFPSKYKIYSKWPDTQYGDYYFITTLLKNLTTVHTTTNKDEIIYIPYILTKCIQDNIGNFGNPVITSL